MAKLYIDIDPHAQTIPYDNENCDLKAELVQEAIDELCARDNAPELIKVNCDDLRPAGCKPIVFEFTELVDQDLCEITKVEC